MNSGVHHILMDAQHRTIAVQYIICTLLQWACSKLLYVSENIKTPL